MKNLFKCWDCNFKRTRYGIHIFAFRACISTLKWHFLVIVLFAFFIW